MFIYIYIGNTFCFVMIFHFSRMDAAGITNYLLTSDLSSNAFVSNAQDKTATSKIQVDQILLFIISWALMMVVSTLAFCVELLPGVSKTETIST